MKKFVAIVVSTVIFFAVAIAVNSAVIKLIYDQKSILLPLWDQTGSGFVFAIIAGFCGVFVKVVHDKIME